MLMLKENYLLTLIITNIFMLVFSNYLQAVLQASSQHPFKVHQ